MTNPEPSGVDAFVALFADTDAGAATAPEPPAGRLPAPNAAQGSSGRSNPIPDAHASARQFIEWVQDAPRGQGMWTDQHGNRHH
jgi:hypothetical protein